MQGQTPSWDSSTKPMPEKSEIKRSFGVGDAAVAIECGAAGLCSRLMVGIDLTVKQVRIFQSLSVRVSDNRLFYVVSGFRSPSLWFDREEHAILA